MTMTTMMTTTMILILWICMISWVLIVGQGCLLGSPSYARQRHLKSLEGGIIMHHPSRSV